MKRPRIFVHSSGNPVKVFSTDLNPSQNQNKSKPGNVSQRTNNWSDAEAKGFFDPVEVSHIKKFSDFI